MSTLADGVLRTTEEQLHEAVLNARLARHHPACCCGEYRDAKGGGYCGPAEWRYSSMVDRILTTICRESS